MRRPLIGVALVVAAVAALGLQTYVVVRTGFTMGDFRAFYCAARVASHGANPYHTEPLRTCETGLGMTMFFEKNPGVTIPAPLPGYALAALVPLAVLPFPLAATIWIVLLLLAWLACVITLSRFARVPWGVAFAVFALSLGAISIPFGEVVPLSLGFICGAAYLAYRGNFIAAALAATGAMVEPHLGLPACLALAVWLPSTRLVLAASFAVLAILSFWVLGFAANVEYFTSVLPAHALSELTRDTQYSATAVLSAFGFSQDVAVRAGSVWYAAMVIAGVTLAGLLARRMGNEAFIVCVPPAFAVFGGTFIHITQIAAAVPAAMLLVSYTSRRYRGPALVALLLLAVPWGWSLSPALQIAPVVPVAYIAWCYQRRGLLAILVSAFVAAGLVVAFSQLYGLPSVQLGAHLPAPAIDPRLAEATWSAYSQRGSHGSIVAWAVRIPTWGGLALLFALLIREAAPRLRVHQHFLKESRA